MFFTGASYTYENSSNKLVHGGQGEVMGPCTCDGTGTRVKTKGEGVRVLFLSNKGNMECLLTEVRRLPAASTAPLSAPTLLLRPKRTVTLPMHRRRRSCGACTSTLSSLMKRSSALAWLASSASLACCRLRFSGVAPRLLPLHMKGENRIRACDAANAQI